MHQLSAVDTGFLAMESDTTYGHVAGIAILDPSTTPSGKLALDDIQAALKDRLHLVPPLTRKLQKVPFNLDRPYWVDDPHFDLGFHVRELALPAPGTKAQFSEQIARLHARRLDRRRPLWEAYLIHGLEGGLVALYTKVHHAAVDGVSGGEILGMLYDLDPDGTQPVAALTGGPQVGTDLVPAPAASANDLLARGLLKLPLFPLEVARGLRRLVPELDRSILERPPRPAPRTPLNGRITPHRRFAYGSISLTDAKRVKKHFGVTVNDVVVTVAAGALRRWLDARDALPDEPLVAMVPVSIRTADHRGTFGNRVSAMLARIPTHISDPAERLTAAHESLRGAKERHQALPAQALQDVGMFVPPALHARATRLAMDLMARPGLPSLVNVVISNVPGPPVPIYLAGAQQVAAFPVSVVTDGLGLNITVLSYRDSIDIGMLADRELVPDVDVLIDHMREELAALTALTKPRSARGVKTKA